MKTHSVLLSLLLATSAMAEPITPTLIPEIDEALKAEIVVEQATATGRTHMRWTGTQYYSAVQSFTWTSASAMGGIGVKLVASQISLRKGATFELRVFEATGSAMGATVGNPLGTYEFTVQGEAAALRDRFLYFKFPAGLKMQENAAYLFEITPTHTDEVLLSLATSNNEDAYAGGWGGVYPSKTTDAPKTISGTSIGDFMFFLTKAP